MEALASFSRDVHYVYDGWNLLAELNATNNNIVNTLLWGMDLSGTTRGAGGIAGLLVVSNSAQGAHFVAYDGSGNIRALQSTGGALSAQYEYGPFGEVIRASGTMASANPVRFSTKVLDPESGMVYYGYRFYNSAAGRWVSRDPVGEKGGPNLLGFVGGNPVSRVDVHGLFGLICDKCKAGNVKDIAPMGFTLWPYGRNGPPSAVQSGLDALNGVEVIAAVELVGAVATGVASGEVAAKVADAVITHETRSPPDMEGIVESLTKDLSRTEGVSIWINVCWKRCESTYVFGGRLGTIPWTRHLDWVQKCGWYESKEEPANGGPGAGGFDVTDAAGISAAVVPSVLAAIAELVH